LSQNLVTLTSWNPLGHYRPVKGVLYIYLYLNLYMFPAQFTKPITQQLYLNPATAHADTEAMC
jgi:hypothetical protein